jgi:hypothetical protein
LQFAVCSLQFAVCSLQFAVCSFKVKKNTLVNKSTTHLRGL